MKKFTAFILAILMVCSLVGCSKSTAFNDEETEAFEYFMTCVKDPSSVIIYGDITSVKLKDSLMMHITYNAKNSYGGYAGVTTAQITVLKSGAMIICDEEDWDFIDLSYLDNDAVRETFEEQNEGSYVHFRDGKAVAAKYDIEYKEYGA